jgi:hypothetical protein
MSRCDYKYYKSFLPKRLPSNLTAKQWDKLNTLSPETNTKFLASMSEFDDEGANALSIIAQMAPQRFSQTTNKGMSMAELALKNQKANKKLMDDTPLNEQITFQEVGERLALNQKKGQPLSTEERALAMPAFVNRMSRLPLLLKQIQHANETGNTAAQTLLAKELIVTMGVAAGISGDKNAASVALNSYKYFKKQMKLGKDINQLFQNGAC